MFAVMWSHRSELYERPSPPKIQEIEMVQSKQEWFSDSLRSKISGFKVKRSKYRRFVQRFSQN